MIFLAYNNNNNDNKYLYYAFLEVTQSASLHVHVKYAIVKKYKYILRDTKYTIIEINS